MEPPIVYPGNIQGRSHKEQGERGCYLVQWSAGEWDLTFLPLHTIRFEHAAIEANTLKSLDDFEGLLEQAKQQFHTKGNIMLDLEITTPVSEIDSSDQEILINEWKHIVNDHEDLDEQWIWIDRIVIKQQLEWNEEELKKGKHFIGEWLRQVEAISDEEIVEWLAQLYHHRKAAPYLDGLSPEDLEEIITESKKITIHQFLLKGERGS